MKYIWKLNIRFNYLEIKQHDLFILKITTKKTALRILKFNFLNVEINFSVCYSDVERNSCSFSCEANKNRVFSKNLDYSPPNTGTCEHVH